LEGDRWAALHGGDHGRARTLFGEALEAGRELGDKMMLAECLEGLAGVAAARGDAERTARVWGAAEALRAEIAVRVFDSDPPCTSPTVPTRAPDWMLRHSRTHSRQGEPCRRKRQSPTLWGTKIGPQDHNRRRPLLQQAVHHLYITQSAMLRKGVQAGEKDPA
jgi:hypothetical protein